MVESISTKIPPEAHIVRTAKGTWIFFKGHSYFVEVVRKKATSKTGSATLSGAVISPMPGKVFKVLVTIGDVAALGQDVLVLEAMKMEHTLTAPCDGKVTTLAVKPGDLVELGQELAVISSSQ